MSEEILNNLQEIVSGHTKRLDKIDATLTEHTAILNEHTGHLNRIDIMLVDHTETLQEIKETMATRTDIAQLITSLDEYVGLARKKDQELLFMCERVNRVEEDVAKIKPLVGLA